MSQAWTSLVGAKAILWVILLFVVSILVGMEASREEHLKFPAGKLDIILSSSIDVINVPKYYTGGSI